MGRLGVGRRTGKEEVLGFCHLTPAHFLGPNFPSALCYNHASLKGLTAPCSLQHWAPCMCCSLTQNCFTLYPLPSEHTVGTSFS